LRTVTTIIGSTISGNSASRGGGIAIHGGSTELAMSIVANSADGGDCQGIEGGSLLVQLSLIEDAQNSCGAQDGVGRSIVGVDPQLGPLQDNGGPTWTHTFYPGSPVTDAIDADDLGVTAEHFCTFVGGLVTDQRGIARPYGAFCDMGAVELVNTAPVAVDDAYSTDEDTPLSVPASGVLSNDIDADGNWLTSSVDSGPAHGTLQLSDDGAVTYTPNAGFSGTDSFTYHAADGLDDSNSATVTIMVNPAAPTNGAPTVDAGADQTITLPAGANLSGTVNDDGLPTTPGAVTIAWSKVSGPGDVTFDDASVATTTANFASDGSYILRLTANDGELSASADVTITVNPETGTAPYHTCGAYAVTYTQLTLPTSDLV